MTPDAIGYTVAGVVLALAVLATLDIVSDVVALAIFVLLFIIGGMA